MFGKGLLGILLRKPTPAADDPDCKGRAKLGLDSPGSGMYSVLPKGSNGGYLGGGLLVFVCPSLVLNKNMFISK